MIYKFLNNNKSYLLVLLVLTISFIPISIKSDDDVPVENIEQFVDIYKRIKEQYVDNVDDEQLFKSAIKGMVSDLDPHSSYLSKDDFNELKIGTTGKFGGLGIEITTEDSFVKVISPIDDTPAQKVGIKSGDLIIKVDDTSLENMSINEAVKLMRGEPGTKVQITVIRKKAKKPIVFDIKREIIVAKGIKSKLFNDDIGYIRLSSFQSNSTNHVKNAIYALSKESKNSLSGLILDLRNNPGGVLGTAVGISDLFLKKGKIVYTNGRTLNSKLEYFATPQDILEGTPLIVMVNEGSASASEIVAGALQDNKRAKILGAKSYGKASVQTIQELSDGSALKLTTARYYTPMGRDIHKHGIDPDITIKISENDIVSLPEPYDKDKQLFEAIKHVKTMEISFR
tara:strand:+ start:47 stop:1240 length:1194 start_codon:yes stop_codon:yes gene_type:complete